MVLNEMERIITDTVEQGKFRLVEFQLGKLVMKQAVKEIKKYSNIPVSSNIETLTMYRGIPVTTHKDATAFIFSLSI